MIDRRLRPRLTASILPLLSPKIVRRWLAPLGFRRIAKCLALAAVLALSMIGTGKAQSLQDQSLQEMKAQLAVLRIRIDQLEAEQRHAPPTPRTPNVRRQSSTPTAHGPSPGRYAAKQAQLTTTQPQQPPETAPKEAEQAKVPPETPPTGRPGLSFRIPGTDTVVRPYGLIKLNTSTDLISQDRSDALSARSIPLSNSAAQRTGGDTQASARRSRLGFETWTPVNAEFGEFHTLIEMDFAGENTSLTTQATSNSYTPRLRKAYADFGLPDGGWGALLFGQNDSLFSDTALSPIQWMSDWTFVGMDKVRQAQIRYTYGFGDGISTSVGVEAPYSDITTTSGASYPDSNGGSGVGWQTAPDITGRVLYKPAWGFLALRGVLRPQIDLNNAGASEASSQFKKSVVGYGIGVTVVVSMLENRRVLTASGNAGNGLGRYLNSTAKGFGAVSDFGLPGITAANATLDTVGVYAGMLGAQYFFTPTLRTNMAIGGARLILPDYAAQFGGCAGATAANGACATVNTSEWAGSINLVWSPFKMFDIGLEYQHVERVLRQPAVTGAGTTADGGIESRLQVTAIGRF